MNKIIQSAPLTLIDQTDSRKLEVYIQSSLPTVQIYNQNKTRSEAFTPNWEEGTGLELKASFFLDSRTLEGDPIIKWYKNEVKDTNEMKDAPDDAEDISTDKKTVTIKKNVLEDTPIITYICQATYQGIVASSRITFTRVDTGLNGQKGADGTSVRILGTAKSAELVDDPNYYTIVYDTGAIVAAELGDAYVLKSVGHDLDGHLFVCALLNGGQDGATDYFIDAGQIQGPAGDPAKVITLIGSAQVFKVGKDGKTITPKAITITAHTVNIDDNSGIKWWYKYDTDVTWTEITNKIVQDTSGKTIISINNNNDVATVNVEYLNGRTSITLKTTYDNAEDALTLYKVFDGIDGEKGNPGDDAPIVFLSNEHISFVADANGETYGVQQNIPTNVVAYRGTTKVEPQIDLTLANASLPDGMSISIDENTMTSIKKITPDFSEIILNVSVDSGVNLGSALSNNGMIPIQVTSPANVVLQLNWTKINAGPEGEAGVGIRGVDVRYTTTEKFDDFDDLIEDDWGKELPIVPEGHYLWTRTLIDYTDSSRDDTVTYTYSKQGEKGDSGTSVGVTEVRYAVHTSASTPPSKPISEWSPAVVATSATNPYLWTRTIFSDGKYADSVARYGTDGEKGSTGVGIKFVTEYYLATASSGGVTISTTGWTTAIQTITADKKYLWNYEIITYTDNTTSTTNPIIIGVFGNTGATGASGKGIKSITEYYLATASASGVVTTTTGWTTTMQTLTATNKYLWNYELITYTDNSTATINPVIIGVYGDRGATGAAGADAYTVLLTNESHVFAGTTSSAVASSATTQILAYKGTTSQSITIVSVNGVSAATASTATGIAGLSFACSALSGASPTITFTCTTAFVSLSGTIPIVLSVGGISITKMFAYSIAFKGATGGQGNPGAPSSSYWLVSNASAVQKTSSGDILFTPAILTFTGRIQTGTTAPTNYAGRWILAYSTDGSTYTDSYTSTANEATASIAASATYKAVRARMYLAGGTTTLLDEQIIPFVSDGETGAPGATGDNAVTFQVYSNNGYALSTSVPTITLQTFAYIGDIEIKSGATFQWYRHNNTDWVAVSGATNAYFNVSRDDVSFSNNYMCKMQFNGTEYVGVVTIEDKNDENKVFASKPYNYFAGDLWIVGTDYAPPSYTVGTMLRAEHTNTGYIDSDWVPATKYDDEIKDLRDTVDSYKQYFSVNSTNGLQIGNSSINNDILTTDTVNAANINADLASLESLDIIGRYSGSTMLQAPIINLGNFSLVIESNGSLSVVANT